MQLHRVTFGSIGKDVLRRLQSKGIVRLAYWDNGFKQMSANKLLRKSEDVRGLTMRGQPSAVLEAPMRRLGAIPVIMDFSAASEALSSGVVAGTVPGGEIVSHSSVGGGQLLATDQEVIR